MYNMMVQVRIDNDTVEDVSFYEVINDDTLASCVDHAELAVDEEDTYVAEHRNDANLDNAVVNIEFMNLMERTMFFSLESCKSFKKERKLSRIWTST